MDIQQLELESAIGFDGNFLSKANFLLMNFKHFYFKARFQMA